MHSVIGKPVRQKQGYDAFIPHPFPPAKGFLTTPLIQKKCESATLLVGKLDGITKLLPDADYFLLMYLRKDAASSSQIEGTRATMMDAIQADIHSHSGLPDDVDDILHYIEALNYGLKRVEQEDFPVSLRFIRELHEVLMRNARATQPATPGEFRTTQNWIGGTRPDNAKFVPPPVDDMRRALHDLEKYLHAEDTTMTMIKAGVIHAQFETIHPFPDGNGRTGRMLITFYLWKERLLEKPVLFLSSYFKRHQNLYYEKLAAYHSGDALEWIEFFLDGVIDIAGEAINTVGDITKLREETLLKIQGLSKRASESAIKVLPNLYSQPIVDNALVQKWTGFTYAGAQQVIDRFMELDILEPLHPKKYGQSYVFRRYTNIFADK